MFTRRKRKYDIRYNKEKDKLREKSYDNDIKVEEMVYELPENIVDEWKTVLNKHK